VVVVKVVGFLFEFEKLGLLHTSSGQILTLV
jgi:hypothetical protein